MKIRIALIVVASILLLFIGFTPGHTKFAQALIPTEMGFAATPLTLALVYMERARIA